MATADQKPSASAKDAADKGAQKAHNAVDDARDAVKDGVDYAARKAEDARALVDRGIGQVNQATDTVANQIQRHPLASIAIAAGVGFLISRLVR